MKNSMAGHLTAIITSPDPVVRDAPLDAFCRDASLETLRRECDDLESFRRASDNRAQAPPSTPSARETHHAHARALALEVRPRGPCGRGAQRGHRAALHSAAQVEPR